MGVNSITGVFIKRKKQTQRGHSHVKVSRDHRDSATGQEMLRTPPSLPKARQGQGKILP